LPTCTVDNKRLTVENGHKYLKKRSDGQKHPPREKKALIMKLKLMVATVKTSRKKKTSVGSL